MLSHFVKFCIQNYLLILHANKIEGIEGIGIYINNNNLKLFYSEDQK
jgi:hypothetical protein